MSFDDYHQKKSQDLSVLTEYHHTDSPGHFFMGKECLRLLPAVRLKDGNFPQVRKGVRVIYSEGYGPDTGAGTTMVSR
jgi:hypothetical protein